MTVRLFVLVVALGCAGLAEAAPPEHEGTQLTRPPWLELGAGAAAAVVAAPAGVFLGAWVGTWSRNLYVALVPALVVLAAVPPLLVTLAEWLVGNRLTPGSRDFQPAIYAALGAHLLAIAGAVLLGASAARVLDVVLFTLAEVALLPTAAALVLWLEADPAPPPTAARSLPLIAVRF